MDEHALFARQLEVGRHQRLREWPPLRRRDRHVAADERHLDGLSLDREQLAGREPRRPPGHLFRLDDLDAGEARQLIGDFEDRVHLRSRR